MVVERFAESRIPIVISRGRSHRARRWFALGLAVLGLALAGVPGVQATPAEIAWSPAGPVEGQPVTLYGPADADWTLPDGSLAHGAQATWTPLDVGAYTVALTSQGRALQGTINVANRVPGAAWKILQQGGGAGAARAVSFQTDSAGFAVGDAGTLLKWNGQQWAEDTAPVHDWRDVDMELAGLQSKRFAWAVAADGAVARWDSAKWSAETSAAKDLRTVDVVPGGLGGYAGGDALYGYTGSAWVPVPVPGLQGTIIGLDLIATNSGQIQDGYFLTTAGQFYRYTSTGWAGASSLPAAAPGSALSVRTANDVWAAAGSEVWHFDGAIWSRALARPGEAFTGVLGVGATEAWAVGQELYRFDGSWANQAHPRFAGVFTALGRSPGGVLWLMTDRGEITAAASNGFTPYAIGRAAIQGVAAVGSGPTMTARLGDAAGSLLLVEDEATRLDSLLAGGAVTALASAPDGSDWAVTDTGRIFAQSGGAWSESARPVTTPLRGLVFVGPGEAWAVGDGGVLLHLIQGQWQPTASPTTRDLLAVDAADGTAFAVGRGGVVLGLVDGAWTSVASPTTNDLFGLQLRSGSLGFAVGNAKILKWAGASWATSLSPGGAVLRDVTFAGPAEAWAVGDAGKLYKWTGSAWSSQGAFTSRNLKAVAAADDGSLVAGGDGGLVAARTSNPASAADFRTPATILEGVPATFEDASIAGYPDHFVAWTWSFTGITATGPQPALIFRESGAVPVALSATDDDGAIFSTTKTVTVLDADPLANAGPDLSADEGVPVTFDASRSQPANLDDPLTAFEWDVDYDGAFTPDLTGPQATYTFVDDGTHAVALRVWDEDSSAVDLLQVAVADAVPTAVAGPDQAVDEGDWVVLDGTGSTSGAADPIAVYEWDLAYDGATFTADAQGAQVSFRPMDDGTRTVALRVLDEDASISIDVFVLTVLDLEPLALLPVDITVFACFDLDLSGNLSVASDADPIARFEWDLHFNGTFLAEKEGEDLTLHLETVGDVTVALLVTDEDGSTSMDTMEITVLPALTGTSPGLANANPGDTLSVRFTVTNPAPFDRTILLDASAVGPANASVTPSSVQVTANATVEVDVDLVIDADAGNATVEVHLFARLELCLDVFIELQAPVEVVPPPPGIGSIDVAVSPATKSVVPDASASFTVTVSNLRPVPDTIALTLAGAPSGWTATLGQAAFALGPGASATTTLTVDTPIVTKIPYSPLKNPHRATVVVTGQSLLVPTLTDQATAKVLVPLVPRVVNYNAPEPFPDPALSPCGLAKQAPLDACYPDPAQQVQFDLLTTWIDGTVVPGAHLAVTVQWRILSTNLGDAVIGKETFAATSDANGLAHFVVPYTLLEDFLGINLNMPGTYKVAATATIFDHVGSDLSWFGVGPVQTGK